MLPWLPRLQDMYISDRVNTNLETLLEKEKVVEENCKVVITLKGQQKQTRTRDI
jgi:hypothetical protein